MSDPGFAVPQFPHLCTGWAAGPCDPTRCCGGGPGLLEDQSVVKAGTWPTPLPRLVTTCMRGQWGRPGHRRPPLPGALGTLCGDQSGKRVPQPGGRGPPRGDVCVSGTPGGVWQHGRLTWVCSPPKPTSPASSGLNGVPQKTGSHCSPQNPWMGTFWKMGFASVIRGLETGSFWLLWVALSPVTSVLMRNRAGAT